MDGRMVLGIYSPHQLLQVLIGGNLRPSLLADVNPDKCCVHIISNNAVIGENSPDFGTTAVDEPLISQLRLYYRRFIKAASVKVFLFFVFLSIKDGLKEYAGMLLFAGNSESPAIQHCRFHALL